MSGLSLECELAQVQMKRYLGGEELPAQLMQSLELHIKSCPGCKAALDEQRMKLASKLAGEKASKPNLLDSLKAKLPKPLPKKPQADVFKAPNPWLATFNTKTVFLSVALAVVLFAMSAIAKDPSKLLGPKLKPAMASDIKDSETKEPGGIKGSEPKDEHGTKDSHEPAADKHAAATPEKEPVDEGHKTEPAADDHKTAEDTHADPHSEPVKETKTDSHHETPEVPKSDHSTPETAKPAPAKTNTLPPGNGNLIIADDHKPVTTKPTTIKAPEHKAEPKTEHKPKPRPRPVPKAPRKKKIVKRATPAAAPKPTGIKVYDPSGNPVK